MNRWEQIANMVARERAARKSQFEGLTKERIIFILWQ